MDRSELLKPDEYVNTVFFGEPFSNFIAVLADAPRQITSHANIEGAIWLTGN